MATPTGDFRVEDKDATKRSGEYGFWTNGSNTYEGSSSDGRAGYSYVGYPMANWVGFAPGLRLPRGLRVAGAALARLPAHPQERLGEILQAGRHRHAGDDPRQPALRPRRWAARRCIPAITRTRIRPRRS